MHNNKLLQFIPEKENNEIRALRIFVLTFYILYIVYAMQILVLYAINPF